MRPPRTRLAVLALPLLGLSVLSPVGAVSAAAPAADPTSDVRINEIAQNIGETDWVELANVGTAPVDVSGWKLFDNSDTRDFALASGTVIPAGGHLVVDVDVDVDGRTGFGLGRADEVRLFQPGTDGLVLVDQFGWSDHTPTTYGRCPDGTGAFGATAAPTPGAANQCAASPADSVRINEIESSDAAGGSDWIELTNIGLAPVDLSGLVVKDDDDTRTLEIPAGTTLAPGGFFVVEEPFLTFGLGGADSARIFDGDTLVDSYSWTQHAGTTYGRFPDGTGEFAPTAEPTKGAGNLPVVATTPAVVINETVSTGGVPGDWVELLNTGATTVDLSGFVVRDSDPLHTAVLPAGASIAPGGFYVVEEAALGFGLGSADMARLYLPDGFTLVDERSWTAHAPTSNGRCGDDWVVTTSVTKGAANDCSAPVRINEVESSGGTPGDWVELKNNGVTPVDVSGWVLTDSDDTHRFEVPAGTTIAAGGYWVADVEASYGLGGADAVRLFDAAGTPVDSYAWTAHASTTYGRCPDGTGDVAVTRQPTRGAANACEGDLETSPWPGSPDVATADPAGTYPSNLSGLVFEESGDVVWAVQNGPGTLHRLVPQGDQWVADAGWAGGKALHYADGTGDVDAEGVEVGADGLYVASERNNAGGGSRPSILRYDAAATGASLSATTEWNLASDLPVLGANAGLEGIAFVPDEVLVAQGFVDQSTGAAYDPARYPTADGVYLVGVEANGTVYAYSLAADGTFTRLASFASGFPGVMELEYEPATEQLWVGCDDGCQGRTALFEVGGAGEFTRTEVVERPAGMPNLNNEGLAIAPPATCVDGAREVLWADDGSTDGHALRSGTLDCVAVPVDPEPEPEPEPQPVAGQYGVGSQIKPGAPWRFARSGAAKPIQVYYAGEGGREVTGTVYVSIRQAGTARQVVVAHRYDGSGRQLTTPVIPPGKGSYQVALTFVPDDDAFRFSVRSFWVWATPTGRP